MAYSKSNDCQIRYGKKFAEKAGVKRGDKILDMGCGTGELTSSLAEIVGKDGQVVGVDPDFWRLCKMGKHINKIKSNYYPK